VFLIEKLSPTKIYKGKNQKKAIWWHGFDSGYSGFWMVLYFYLPDNEVLTKSGLA